MSLHAHLAYRTNPPGPRPLRRATAITLALALVSVAAPAHAQQPLSVFLDAADTHAIDLLEARALASQAGSAVDEARARLLPSFTATGAYTRNEIAVLVTIPTGVGTEVRQSTITPYDQLTGTFTLNVPIVDLSAWSTFFAAESSADAADARIESGALDVRATTLTAYYQLVAARAVRDSGARALGTAEENASVAGARASSGIASELDAARATSDLERARQTIAEAELQVALAERSLFVLTGLAPSGERVSLDDDLRDEIGLDAWLAHAEAAPSVRAAALDRLSAERSRDGAWLALLPTLSGSMSERLTNAAGFGPEAQWALGLTLSWTLDFGRPATIEAREDAVAVVAAREERTRLGAETAIFEAWHRVRSLVARARAARSALESSVRAASVARARYDAGTGTQLDVSQAERDLFAAEVARTQADADLAVQRLVLRLRSGVELPRGTP